MGRGIQGRGQKAKKKENIIATFAARQGHQYPKVIELILIEILLAFFSILIKGEITKKLLLQTQFGLKCIEKNVNEFRNIHYLCYLFKHILLK